MRVAAVGDLHCGDEADSLRLRARFAAAPADLLLLAGDLTASGQPEEGALVGRACRDLGIPVVAVLGNHDNDARRRDEVAAAVRREGGEVLDGEHRVLEVGGVMVGVAGTTGSFGGFPGLRDLIGGRSPPGWLRDTLVRETAALEAGLRAIAGCAVRIALLHYSPTAETLVGERRELWHRLGSAELAGPIARHEPDLVVHAHAHAGRAHGLVGRVPVRNVSSVLTGEEVPVVEVGAGPAA